VGLAVMFSRENGGMRADENGEGSPTSTTEATRGLDFRSAVMAAL
jgi:hypothetical protein